MSFLRYSFYLILILASCNKKSNDETVASETTATEEIANSAPQTNSTNEVTPPMPTASSDVQIKVFNNTSEHPSGYGYDILMDGRLYIHQTNIPAIPGNKGFTSEDDALKTGELMAFKIRNNIMPPSITIEELDSLGVNMK